MEGSPFPSRIDRWLPANATDVDAVAPRVAATGFLPGSAETWPAAGGGLLLGMVVPALADAVPVRGKMKTLFIRVGTIGLPTVIVPYVRLEAEVLHCAAELVAEELWLSPDEIAVDNAGSAVRRRIADLCPACEVSLAFLGAIVRTLLVAAAAEVWKCAPGKCVLERDRITWRRRSASYAELAADAALVALPSVVTTRRGRRMELRTWHMEGERRAFQSEC
jgi:isoquinoline 1-oxidoreductase beta subunit